MKILKILKTIIQATILFLVIITTYDFFNHFIIIKEIKKIACQNTIGDCHFILGDFYSIFHIFSTYLCLFLGGNSFVFLLGQIITLIFYYYTIHLFFKLIETLFKNSGFK